MAIGLSLFFVFTVVILVWKKKEVKELCGACSNRVTAINASTKLKADEAKRERKRAKSLEDETSSKGLVLTEEERKQLEKFYKDKGNIDQEDGKQSGKFNPRSLSFADSSDALDFAEFLGMSAKYLDQVENDGEKMMKQEIERLENRENRQSTDPPWWYAKAGGNAEHLCPDTLDNESEVLYHWKYVVEKKSSEHEYKNGIRDKGRDGKSLSDFMECKEVKDAKGLERTHVIALRLYTTVLYTYINEPLRFHEHYREVAGDKPRHPLAAVVWFIFKGLKILRKNSDIGQGISLWRGVKDVKVEDAFLKSGGFNCEKAPMSTTKDLKVALAYSKGGGVIFKIEVTSVLQMGGDITFLSAFPEEKEVLYPPLTQLNLNQTGKAGNKKVRQEKIFINGNGEGASITVFEITPDQSSSDGNVSSPSRRKNSFEGKTLEVDGKSLFERRPSRTQSLNISPRPSRTQSQPARSSFTQVIPAFEQTPEPIVSRPSMNGEVPIAAVVPMPSPNDHYAQQIKAAKQLWDDGAIDEDEFKEMKQEYIDEKARALNEINARSLWSLHK